MKLFAIFAAFGLAICSSPTRAQDVDGRFDVGGRAIRLACVGQGAPTVVIDAGMGSAPVEDQAWRRIAERVSQTTRVCLHDRAGLGQSDPPPPSSHPICSPAIRSAG